MRCTSCSSEQTADELCHIEGEALCYPCLRKKHPAEENTVYNLDSHQGIKMLITESVDLLLIDPPYLIEGGFLGKIKSQEQVKGNGNSERMQTYDNYQEPKLDYKALSKQFYRIMKNDTHAYIFSGIKEMSHWIIEMEKAGFIFTQLLIWEQENAKLDVTMGLKYMENKELILYFRKGYRKLNWQRNERETRRTVLHISSKKSPDSDFHPASKPHDLLKILIQNSSNEGDLVVDCFAGSGNHLISAMKLNRRFIGFELSPVFHQKIQQRIINQKQQRPLLAFEVTV